jgi:hypothetical protein
MVDCKFIGVPVPGNSAGGRFNNLSSLWVMELVEAQLWIPLGCDFKAIAVGLNTNINLRVDVSAVSECEIAVGGAVQAEFVTVSLDLTTPRANDRNVVEFLGRIIFFAKLNPQVLSMFASWSLARPAPSTFDPFLLPAVEILPKHFQLKGSGK